MCSYFLPTYSLALAVASSDGHQVCRPEWQLGCTASVPQVGGGTGRRNVPTGRQGEGTQPPAFTAVRPSQAGRQAVPGE